MRESPALKSTFTQALYDEAKKGKLDGGQYEKRLEARICI
jgi:hypothetical protein